MNSRVLGFWFKDLWSNGKWVNPGTESLPVEHMKRWFNSTESLNRQIKELFEADIASALNGTPEEILISLVDANVSFAFVLSRTFYHESFFWINLLEMHSREPGRCSPEMPMLLY